MAFLFFTHRVALVKGDIAFEKIDADLHRAFEFQLDALDGLGLGLRGEQLVLVLPEGLALFHEGVVVLADVIQFAHGLGGLQNFEFEVLVPKKLDFFVKGFVFRGEGENLGLGGEVFERLFSHKDFEFEFVFGNFGVEELGVGFGDELKIGGEREFWGFGVQDWN